MSSESVHTKRAESIADELYRMGFYTMAFSVRKLVKERDALLATQQRKPEEWETVCYECGGSGWRARDV